MCGQAIKASATFRPHLAKSVAESVAESAAVSALVPSLVLLLIVRSTQHQEKTPPIFCFFLSPLTSFVVRKSAWDTYKAKSQEVRPLQKRKGRNANANDKPLPKVGSAASAASTPPASEEYIYMYYSARAQVDKYST
jgi:hypothetical protein